ncbi:putative neuropeptide Y receptor 11 [Babylonia areolata]|uniref:putative neuropeptide Y receptor 11 n=1 Tax=Babylonia areolata TaxID=304850 RepID=UPI003FD45D8A
MENVSVPGVQSVQNSATSPRCVPEIARETVTAEYVCRQLDTENEAAPCSVTVINDGNCSDSGSDSKPAQNGEKNEKCDINVLVKHKRNRCDINVPVKHKPAESPVSGEASQKNGMPPLDHTAVPSPTLYFNTTPGGWGDTNHSWQGGGDLQDSPPGHVSKDFAWMFPLLEQMRDERTFDSHTEALLILAFVLFITFGALGNGLVCFVVARNPHMRTPRNIFIINLAISDLTLCVFTQPLNLYLLIKSQWELGSFMCKFVTMFQGTNLFVSTISITAIALDRFQVIVYPTKDSMKKVGAAVGLLSVWVISFLMASPALLFQVLDAHPPLEHEFPDFFLYNCIEDEDMKVEKRAYTVAQMVVQYILPFIILTVAHLRICNKLRYRMVNQQQQPAQPRTRSERKSSHQPRNSQQERRSRRKRKTNLLLASIAMVFALSWLPLNIFNLLSEFHGELFLTGETSVDISLAYAICHLLVLCSACVNPVVYGWFNDNFKSEFLKVICCPCCRRLREAVQKLLCCMRSRPGVPSITLTKASNGSGVLMSGGGEEEVGVREKLTSCRNEEDFSTNVNFITVVQPVS